MITKQLCDYGCGQKATHQFKEGKYCCDTSWKRCPGTKQRLAEKFESYKIKQRLLKELQDGKHVCYICGEKANYLVTGNKPCCTKNAFKCPGFHDLRSKHKKVYYKNPESKVKLSKLMLECQNRDEVKKKKSESMKQLHRNDPEFQKNYKKGIKKANKSRQDPVWRCWFKSLFQGRFKDPEFRRKYYQGITKDFNKDEQVVMELLDSLFNKYFKYNFGDKFRVGRFAPDFYNENDKICVDYMGEYFHTKLMEKRSQSKTQYINERTKKFKKLGYKLLVVWGPDLKKDPDKVMKKLIKFMEVK